MLQRYLTYSALRGRCRDQSINAGSAQQRWAGLAALLCFVHTDLKVIRWWTFCLLHQKIKKVHFRIRREHTHTVWTLIQLNSSTGDSKILQQNMEVWASSEKRPCSLSKQGSSQADAGTNLSTYYLYSNTQTPKECEASRLTRAAPHRRLSVMTGWKMEEKPRRNILKPSNFPWAPTAAAFFF